MTVEWRGDEFIAQVLRPAVREGLGRAGAALDRQIRINLNANASPSAPFDFPGKDTGQSGRSISYAVVGDDRVRVGTNLAHLRHLEYGYTARGNVTVPLTPEAKRMRRRHRTLRERNDLVFIKTPRAAFLVKNVGGKNARTEFLFVLKKSVTVRPRPWARRSLDMAREKIATAFFDGVRRGVAQRAAGGAA